MVKVCAVVACETGRTKERSRLAKLGLRQLSLFRAPKCPDLLQKWEEALSQNIGASNFICENHFKAGDILKADITKMPDGTVNVMPRLHYGLRKGAIPTLLNSNDDQMSCELSHVDQFIEQSQDQSQDAIEEPEEHEIVEEIIEDSTNNEIDAHEDNAIIVDKVNELSIETVEAHLRITPLPETWSWIRSRGGITFAHYNRLRNCIGLCMELAPDLSITCWAPHGKKMSMNCKVSSINDIWSYFRPLERLQVCVGTEMEANRRAEVCCSFIPVSEQYQRQRRNPRCKSCRILRQRLRTQDYELKKKANKIPADQLIRTKLDLCRRKCKRLEQKVLKFKFQADYANMRCATIIKQTRLHKTAK